MTRSKYFLACILQKFGVIRKTKRLTEASYEAHLMQDGEEILGAYCWQNIEEIEELSLEYWNIRGLDRKKKQILEKIETAETLMNEAQARKASVLNQGPDPTNPALLQKKKLSGKLKALEEDHEQKMASALATKKSHRALKMKLEVLQEESGNEQDIKNCLSALAELREAFMKEKAGLETIKDRIEGCQAELRAVDEQIGEDLRGSKGETNQAYASISRANREITQCRAELTRIEEEQGELFRAVGHFLNINAKRSDCQKACRQHRTVLMQIRLLYFSTQWNRRLVEKLNY